MVDFIKSLMKKTGIELLWEPQISLIITRFVHGAATSCNAEVFAYAGAQVKKHWVTKELGGQNYVFWGGREGYETLLNTDIGWVR